MTSDRDEEQKRLAARSQRALSRRVYMEIEREAARDHRRRQAMRQHT